MKKKNILLILLFLVILCILFLFYKSQDIKRTYRSEVLKALSRTEKSDNSILTMKEIQSLPKPVQKYLIYVGAIGKKKVQNVRIVFDGEMKLDPQKDWIKVKTQQYNFFDNPTRMFFIKANMSGIPVVGLDSYKNGKGNMLIKLAGILTVADAKGPEMDKGEAVTLFNDMCLLTPSALIDKRIQWETVDPLTVKAAFNDNGGKVSALLYFNNKGELTNFITDDRYYAQIGKAPQKVRWSTPVQNYKDYNGFKLPSYGEAIWNFPQGDYCYAKFNIKKVETNCVNYK